MHPCWWDSATEVGVVVELGDVWHPGAGPDPSEAFGDQDRACSVEDAATGFV